MTKCFNIHVAQVNQVLVIAAHTLPLSLRVHQLNRYHLSIMSLCDVTTLTQVAACDAKAVLTKKEFQEIKRREVAAKIEEKRRKIEELRAACKQEEDLPRLIRVRKYEIETSAPPRLCLAPPWPALPHLAPVSKSETAVSVSETAVLESETAISEFGVRNSRFGIQNTRFGIRNGHFGIQSDRFGLSPTQPFWESETATGLKMDGYKK